MREHWMKYQVKDIIEGLFDGPHATPAPSDEGPVFFGVKNLTEDGRLDLKEIRHIAEADFPRWTKRVLPQNDDIVFTYEASLHRYGLLKDDLRCCLGRRMALLRLDKSIVDPQFLLYYFLSSEWKQTVEQSIIVGATVSRIPISDVPSFELSLPTLEEQTRIAKVLADIDAKIDLNNRINAELEAMAKLLYDYWFVQFDFPFDFAQDKPNAHGQPYKSSGGKMVYNERLKREIPEGWEDVCLGDLGDFKNGINYDPSEEGDTRARIINVRDISSSSIFISNKGLDEIWLKGNDVKKYLVENKSIIIARSGIPGATRLIADYKENTIYCGFIICFRVSKIDLKNILFYQLKNVEKAMSNQSGGTIMKNVNQGTLRDIKLALPNKEQFHIIQNFNDVLNPMFAKMNLVQKENQQLIELRDWLLPILMNGQVKVR
ncbi:MAG: restriction endonuclease subunit S [Lewinellaceae bacterium]|nr:restriction endonuclease subunit S [Lewinellaceae bacterium]